MQDYYVFILHALICWRRLASATSRGKQCIRSAEQAFGHHSESWPKLLINCLVADLPSNVTGRSYTKLCARCSREAIEDPERDKHGFRHKEPRKRQYCHSVCAYYDLSTNSCIPITAMSGDCWRGSSAKIELKLNWK